MRAGKPPLPFLLVNCDGCVAGLTHWQSPSFFAYYPCNFSFPGLLGEMLCAGFATQTFSWIGSPAATELETVRPVDSELGHIPA